MKLTAYRLSDGAAVLRPASAAGVTAAIDEAAPEQDAARRASCLGWELLCPVGFAATWNGGPAPEDIDIRIEAPDAATPAFVQSVDGGGRLTFYTGYQCAADGEASLWLRGPVNQPRDGLAPLEELIDATPLPATITISWQFTHPGHTVRFAAGEPFGVLVPFPNAYVAGLTHELVAPDAAVDDLLDQAAAQLAANPALHAALQRLGADQAVTAQTPPAAAQTGAAQDWAARLSDPPPISCLCPTYGRVALLEEAIHAFLQQDYPGQKELIVLNDYAEQTLVFEHPEVKIINVPRRFSSVGEKYKAAAALAAHDLLVVWHDDDIYLPHRLSLSVAQFRQKQGFYKPGRAWFWNDGQLSGPEVNLFHGGACFSRELLVKTQGYPHVDSSYDIGFELRCEDAAAGSSRSQAIMPEDVYHIYRWNGTGSYHMSAMGQNGHVRDAVVAHVQVQAERGEIPRGEIILQPGWKTDYAAQVRAFLQNGHARVEPAPAPFPPPYIEIPGPEPLEPAAVAGLFRGTHPLKLSVVLPALNESVLLQRTVAQFQATLPADCEVIVVDNGSIDGSADFLLGQDCPGVRLIQSAKPLGVAGARNRGLEAARGEVVVFADAHIDLPCNWWQPIVDTLNRPNVGVVGPGIGVMGRLEHKVACGQRIAEPNLRVEWLGWKQEESHPVPSLGGGFMAMRRATLDQVGAFDCGMSQWGSEDLELCVRYWLLGYEVWVVPAVTVLHYFRTENPLKVRPGIVTHNQLRVALLHFGQERIGRVVSALKGQADFGMAMAHAVDSDVWQQRAAFAARRTRDDDWFFETFKETCPM